MYLTFYTKPTAKQITFEELLKNPFMTVNDLPTTEAKKLTVGITKEYGQRLYTKVFGDNSRRLDLDINTLTKDLDTSEHYRHFEIPKKNSNKMRPIDAPDALLSAIQNGYKNYIENVLKVQAHKAAHAYVAKRSTITAMQEHQRNNSKWFLQIDLKNFFNSIDEKFLRKMLMEVYPFKFIPEENLEGIIKSALLNNELPQGSHLSPTLTNIIMVPIDYAISEILHNYKKHHYVYTRYADDITISCKEKFNWMEIKCIIQGAFDAWEVPFRINEEKTRFGSSAGRNYHVGLIINKDNQISVGHEKNNKFKAQVFNFCIAGDEWSLHDVQKFNGIISYYKAIEPDFVEKILNKYGQKFNMDIKQKIYERLRMQ